MSNELPPPHWTMTSGGMEAWNADQMREYGLACKRAAYERAAKQCLIVRHNSPADLTYQEGCTDCADAIRTIDHSDNHGPDWTTRDGEYLK